MAQRSRLLFLSAILATALVVPESAWAQRGRGGASSSGGSVGRSSGGSVGRSSGGSIGRSAPSSRPSYQGRGSTPARSRPSAGSTGRSSPRVSPTPSRPTPRVVSPRVSPTPSTGRVPRTSTYTPRIDTGRGSTLRGASPGTQPDAAGRTTSPSPRPSYGSSLRGLDTGSRGPSSGRLGGSTDFGGARREPELGLRARPSTSTAVPTRGGDPIVDFGRSAAPQQRRTPFPSMYRPAPETLSGARISALDRLQSQRAQQRVGSEGLRSSERAETRSILERYSRDASGRADAVRGAERADAGRGTSPGLSEARDRSLSRARAEGLSRQREPAVEPARPTTRTAGAERARERTPSETERATTSAREARARYTEARREGSDTARRAERTARAAAIASDTAFRTALRATKVLPGVPGEASISGGWSTDVAVGGTFTGDFRRFSHSTSNWYWYSWYPSFCFGWWGSGWWWGASWGWGWYSPWRCAWWYPHSYWYPSYGYYYPYYYPTYYAYSPPAVYQTVYYGDTYYGDEYVEDVPAQAVAEQQAAAPAQPVVRAGEDSLMGRATAEYLSLGDRAFVEGSYGKAVKYYAKAVEYSPNDGVLYLVLSDALFATGDYHYAAYALRRALELAPDLAEVVIDKRQFYGDPQDFDQQLALLEKYLDDHFLDDDARLVLAANYLFGAMPEKCVALLDSPFSIEVRESATGQLIHAAARATMAAQH